MQVLVVPFLSPMQCAAPGEAYPEPFYSSPAPRRNRCTNPQGMATDRSDAVMLCGDNAQHGCRGFLLFQKQKGKLVFSEII